MTTHLDTSMEFLGWPVSKLRAVLRAQNVGKSSFGDVGYLSAVKLTSGAAAAMLGEAFLLGFIAKVDEDGNPDPNGGYGLTKSGKAIAAATAMRRTKKDNAKRILERVLAKAAELAVDAVTPIKVEKIWVFGSYIDPSRPDVGDLDVVIETRFTGIDGTSSFRRRLEYIRDRYPGLLPSGFDPIFGGMDDYFVNRMLYGARKPALLAPNDIPTLISLGCPCALYFDIDNGGIIEPQFHARHPDSPGRSNTVSEKLAMPEFELMKEFSFTPPVVATHEFLMGGGGADVEVTTSRLDSAMEDSFVLDSYPRMVPMTVKRKLTFSDTEWAYEASLSVPKGMSKGGRNVDGRYRPDIRNAVDLLHADILRLAAFRQEQGAKVEIYADVSLSKSVKTWESDYDFRHRRFVLHDHETLGLDAFPTPFSWGVDFALDGYGGGYIGPAMMDDDDWDSATLPFSRNEYEAWAKEHGIAPTQDGPSGMSPGP
ncbi:hypothetical protein OIU34_18450 [Pararhizobium sp. BT-229]|uniref:hypothetical protein n=1 Tax=Pararhizobium sp. BT-229 TaxID=2986923 RepID=UPI0021F6BA29|nr:hypothetical protein [Pararhizobium sp. BT-229]MCV9963860.1 hypothetical protein [Pararhizobium sp. BT-229]